VLIVADTGPLISLAVIDKLDILDRLFGWLIS
jgi:predicted nucleic acid-binding protein